VAQQQQYLAHMHRGLPCIQNAGKPAVLHPYTYVVYGDLSGVPLSLRPKGNFALTEGVC